MTIRPARPGDVDRIQALLHDAYYPELRPYMIYCQRGIGEYLRLLLEFPGMPPARALLVETDESDEARAFAEFRALEDGIALLAYICVSPLAQGRGVARGMIEHFVENHRDVGEIRLDVFEHNHRALNLYRRLGFVDHGSSTWLVRPLTEMAGSDPAQILDLPASMAAFERFGFCELTVPSEDGPRRVGRMGDGVLRCASLEHFQDDDFLASLAAVFPTVREAFLVVPPGADTGLAKGRTAALSYRMAWRLDR